MWFISIFRTKNSRVKYYRKTKLSHLRFKAKESANEKREVSIHSARQQQQLKRDYFTDPTAQSVKYADVKEVFKMSSKQQRRSKASLPSWSRCHSHLGLVVYHIAGGLCGGGSCGVGPADPIPSGSLSVPRLPARV